jgi:hypothetical protein
MINTAINHSAAAAANQNAVALRRTQSTQTSTAPAPQTSAQYNFAEIFGAASDERGSSASTTAAKPQSASATAHVGGTPAIATAATILKVQTQSATPPRDPNAAKETSATATNPSTTNNTGSSSTTSTTATTSTSTGSNTTTPVAVASPGIGALVTAIMSGTFKGTYVSDPAQLKETNPAGTETMPNVYYASDQTASQLAQLLGGTVVQMKAFGQDQGWSEPNANFIQLPNGQTFNAADLAYYSRSGVSSPAQLTADLTQTINEGAAWTNYYKNGGTMPTFTMGYVGPPIQGMTYAAGMIGADGNVINPAMQQQTSAT